MTAAPNTPAPKAPNTPDRPDCPCQLCAPGVSEEFRSEHWAQEAADVRAHGVHVVGIVGGDVPDWAFTVGLWHSHRLPEVAMFGLRVHDLMHWVGAAATRLREGAPTTEDSLLAGVLDGYPLTVKPVDPGWHRPLLGTAVGFYRREPVPVVQLVWPDAERRWPWERAASSGCRAQPQLWLPVDAHPQGVWTEEAAQTA
ncbi:DUF4262 domain-containing protein [Streptomyces sp. CB01881]|uniref:DUF4262 domain-containing protein n=1 Tax=Streptomyces sp. CB01881 TaxID=2078691 RepID=UPI001386A7AF|nr:DUF4262 domain-containing protein [Streptomyces sp. CB01881]